MDINKNLENSVFTFNITKNRKVLIYYYGKLIKTLSNNQAEKFIYDIKNLSCVEEQLLLAKVTGNFKRGNEKNNKK